MASMTSGDKVEGPNVATILVRLDRMRNPLRRQLIRYLLRLSRIATAGRALPSRNSRKAPPPVEMYEICSARPYLATDAKVSTPPAIEKPGAAAMASASTLVPLPN